MTGGSGAGSTPSPVPDEELDRLLKDPDARAWIDEHRLELRRYASGQAILYQMLLAGVVLGLAAQVAGYLLKTVATTEPFGLAVDLLYTLGLALWTGVVVVVFVQVIPEAKRRQIKRALDAFEAVQRENAPGKDIDPASR